MCRVASLKPDGAADRSAATAELVAAIHASPSRGVFTVTGGGSIMLRELLAVAGASATVLEARVPYAEESLREFLGARPEQACSAQTARALAMRSFQRARQLGGHFGLAITASLATNRPKRGALEAHLAFQDAWHTRSWALMFDNASSKPSSRKRQEEIVAETALQALACALGIGNGPAANCETAAGGKYANVVLGTETHVCERMFPALLPGAFNPLHAGHQAMRDDAARHLNMDVGFELSVANVDKPPLDYIALNRRLAQFAPNEVVVTNTPTFIGKARALANLSSRGIVFVVGADTLLRVVEPSYYADASSLERAIDELRALRCRFLVYGRMCRDGFKTLADLDLPAALAAICQGVPESQFRQDVSSTELRRQAQSATR